MQEKDVIAEQIEYYRARAPEYDQWFSREGRYDRGPEHTASWETEVAEVRSALHAAPLGDTVLELACGTGIWTAELAGHSRSVTAVDSSSEVLNLNRERVGSSAVRYVEADLFHWNPPGRFDSVFFGFWLSHIPPQRFESFWGLVERSLNPGGRVFFIDNRWYRGYRWPHEQNPPQPSGGTPWIAKRELNDGTQFSIVKLFYEASDLGPRLRALGWEGQVSETANFFIWGDVRLAAL